MRVNAQTLNPIQLKILKGNLIWRTNKDIKNKTSLVYCVKKNLGKMGYKLRWLEKERTMYNIEKLETYIQQITICCNSTIL